MKPKVAFFDFACCEGCQLQVANLEEDILGLVNIVDVVEFREVLTGSAPAYDVAIIEGSITRPEDEARIKDIRNRSKVLVAYGACATTGGVNKIKNLWGDIDKVKKEVYGKDAGMSHLETYPTKAVNEVVKVDYYVHGCPITRSELLKVVKALVSGTTPDIPEYPVCVECKMLGNECMYDKGQVCLGPISRAGCNAICPSNNSPCEGCRGTVPNPNKNAMHEVLAKYKLSVDDIKRRFTLFALDPEVGT
jgi:coenzyme F420-reducing hydrogenase gamma subunit